MKNREFLAEQLNRVNSWLSFAEAKNAALIAFNVAILSVDMKMPEWALCIFRIAILVSIVISLISFWPNFAKKSSSRNLLFYKDIAELDSQYKEIINESKDKIKDDYIDEIIINSKITMKKYYRFKQALAIDVGIMVFLCTILIMA